jgi:hypothetical protein
MLDLSFNMVRPHFAMRVFSVIRGRMNKSLSHADRGERYSFNDVSNSGFDGTWTGHITDPSDGQRYQVSVKPASSQAEPTPSNDTALLEQAGAA